MKKLIFILTAVVFLFTACEKEEASLDPTATTESGFHKDACTDDVVTKMIAGGGKYDENCTGFEVGTITVHDNGIDAITVTYQITEPGWVIDVTHLYVGLEYDAQGKGAIPSTKKGNPKIGQFPYGEEYDVGQSSVTIIIDGDDYPTGVYVIAAHAGVSGDFNGSLEDFCTSLPETATVMVVSGEPDSYMAVTISDDGWLNGVYEGWCVDQAEGIDPNTVYELSDVYCSYEELPDGIIYDPANLDLVNWVINQGYVGTASGSKCNGELYTVKDVQNAIWYLVDDQYEEDPTCRTKEIVAEAVAKGENYVPGCGEHIAVIFDPGVGVQKIIIELPLVCGDETAWGYGYYVDGDDVGPCHLDYADPGANGISFTESGYYGGNAWGWYFGSCNWSYVAP